MTRSIVRRPVVAALLLTRLVTDPDSMPATRAAATGVYGASLAELESQWRRHLEG